MADSFSFRPGSLDESIYHSVNTYNEYRLPDSFAPDDVILDIGAHIGSFCHAAALRGSRRVFGFEADEENYRLAVRNLARHGEAVRLTNKAVWRSDRQVESLFFHATSDPGNTGGGNVGWADSGKEVPVVPFDEIVRSIAGDGRRRIRFLKIDCEGSEFPILLTSRLLSLVDEIAGEYHEFGGDHDPWNVPKNYEMPGVTRLTVVELTEALAKEGFSVEHRRTGETNIGIFFAKRIAVAPRKRTIFKPHSRLWNLAGRKRPLQWNPGTHDALGRPQS